MSAAALLKTIPNPTDDDIDAAMSEISAAAARIQNPQGHSPRREIASAGKRSMKAVSGLTRRGFLGAAATTAAG